MSTNQETAPGAGTDYEKLLETATAGGRPYRSQRWTLGNSRELVEGEAPESKLVTLAWIVVPILLALATIWLMPSGG